MKLISSPTPPPMMHIAKKTISFVMTAVLLTFSTGTAYADNVQVEGSDSGWQVNSVAPLYGYPTQPLASTLSEQFTKSLLNSKTFEVKNAEEGADLAIANANVSVKKGKLELGSQNGIGSQVASKKLFTYGTFTIKAKANKDSGMASTIYLYGEKDDGSTHEEIDFELSSLQPNQVSISNNHDDDWENADAQNEFHQSEIVDVKKKGLPSFKSNTKYNTYKIEWAPGVIRWYVNNKLVSQQTEAVPSTPMELRIATYHTDWPGFLSSSTSGNGSFSVDSVRYVSDTKAQKVSLMGKKIQVKGDSDCKSNVDGALNQLKSEPWHYNFVVGYIDLIECVETGSVMWVWETPRRHTAGRASRDDAVQFAADLVHEACHSYEYTSYQEMHPDQDVPELEYSGRDAEEKCLNYQTDYLRRIGQKQRADGYKDAMASEWWKVDLKDMTY